ncbi:protein of unknown function DUF820 [Thermosinus carboxydivorans Nor1]|uniref:Putative restriction endonuclease domain-containing protein n=1 Tax=Thermosinus carboxydivorans Nor1 TaxID=401526 RepID=A1HT43_9FIRM|nr:Uma2 family endonuclease [Thermosinus carboxydivorans]EAX46807.1 protein of unknown function DUF820 [Thermosinus carboxydivorans Nor1]
MTVPARKPDQKYTYGDYLAWPDDERWELINGVPYSMTPAPSRRHQAVTGEIYRQIANYIKTNGGPCQVYVAPFDVRLPKGGEKDEDIDTVVQPDIVVVCDRKKLDPRGLRGAPDLIVEVVSPATASKDKRDKFLLYERSGVREYWIVEPQPKLVTVFTLAGGRYGRPDVYAEPDQIPVGIFPDCIIDLAAVFADLEPDADGEGEE